MLIHFIHGYYCIYRPWQPLTYLYLPYCISLIYFSFIKIRMFLYARIYWLAEFGDISCLQFNYLRVETLTPTWDTLTPTWEDFVGRFCWPILRVTLSSSPTKLCVRPESMIVDTLGGICIWLRMMNMDKVICIGYFVARYKKNNDVFLHWQHREKCPEVIKT
jgi:hypothetical protein